MLYIIGAAIVLGLMKRCDPARGHSIYYQRKGRRE